MALDTNNKKDREKLRRLFIMKKTEIAMMADRGFNTETVQLLQLNKTISTLQFNFNLIKDLTFEQFVAFRNSNNIFPNRESFSCIYYKSVTNDKGQQFLFPMLVMYLGCSPFEKTCSTYTEKLNVLLATMRFHNIILITENGISTKEKTRLLKLTAGINFWFFDDYELAFNRTKFALAPIQTYYWSPDLVPTFEKEEELQAKQLPCMSKNDILAKWYGSNVGGVFTELIMGTDTNQEVFYRIVTNTTK